MFTPPAMPAMLETHAALHFIRQAAGPVAAHAFHASICEVCCAELPCYFDQEERRDYCLPCLEKAVTASRAESLLTPDSDVYDVSSAFDLALDTAYDEKQLLARYTARYPQFTDDLAAVCAARVCYGWTLRDLVEEEYDGDPPIAVLARPTARPAA